MVSSCQRRNIPPPYTLCYTCQCSAAFSDAPWHLKWHQMLLMLRLMNWALTHLTLRSLLEWKCDLCNGRLAREGPWEVAASSSLESWDWRVLGAHMAVSSSCSFLSRRWSATPLFRHQVQIQSRTSGAEPPSFCSILIWRTCEGQGTGLILLLGLNHIACFNFHAFGSESREEIAFSSSTRYVKRKEVEEEIFLFGLAGESAEQPKGIDLL